MLLFIPTLLLHTCSVCHSSCLEISFSGWVFSWNPFFPPGDGVVVSHPWQGEAAFHLTPPIWLKFQLKLVRAKISIYSEVIPNSSRGPVFGAHSCSIINVRTKGNESFYSALGSIFLVFPIAVFVCIN